jgi:hypothetical protein
VHIVNLMETAVPHGGLNNIYVGHTKYMTIEGYVALWGIWGLIPLYSLVFRTYAEEENCEAIFRRSGSEFIILRIPRTENGTFFGQKNHVIGG